MNEKRSKWRKNQREKRKRLILERPHPDYPDMINSREYWDEIVITRHTPYGDRETKIILFMCSDKIDSHYVSRDGYMKLINKRPKRMGSYKVGELIGKLLGRRGTAHE
ncbi:hypothetical protein KAR91_29860 [Candidatus Pacearchaeota archaeon]|nr:hypothetical protein [Candidatus Pacearchaeota archaeon]